MISALLVVCFFFCCCCGLLFRNGFSNNFLSYYHFILNSWGNFFTLFLISIMCVCVCFFFVCFPFFSIHQSYFLFYSLKLLFSSLVLDALLFFYFFFPFMSAVSPLLLLLLYDINKNFFYRVFVVMFKEPSCPLNNRKCYGSLIQCHECIMWTQGKAVKK